MKGRNTFSVICIAKKQRMTKRGEYPIFCRVTINGQRAEFSTNIRLKPSQWNDKTNQPIGRDALGRTATTQLLQIQARLLEDYRAGELAGHVPTPHQQIDGYQGIGDSKTLIGMFDEHIARCKELPDDEITPATIERYAICRRHLLQFLQETASREDIHLTEIGAKFLDDFEHFLRTVRKCAHNTMIKYIKNLRHIIKLAVQYRYITSDPFIGRKMRLQEVEIAYLTKEELLQMQNKQIGIPRMEQVRDRFLFGCYTGLAFIDMEQLSMDHLTTDAGGQLWIRKRRQKTKQMCSIPLLPSASELLDKYADHPCRTEGCAFPSLSNQITT